MKRSVPVSCVAVFVMFIALAAAKECAMMCTMKHAPIMAIEVLLALAVKVKQAAIYWLIEESFKAVNLPSPSQPKFPSSIKSMDLNGKVALVTGAANGIGMATVQQLLKNGLKGVSMCDIDSKNGEDAALSFTKEYGKDRIIFIKTDVTKEKDLEEAFKKTKETFGTIDIVINNAGIIGEDRWEAEIEINVKGVVRGTQLALEYMGKHKGGNGGAVVNIASVAGLGTKSACPVYDGTKFFVVGYSQSISFPLMAKRHGVRILCMCPGATDTPILTEIFDTFEKLDVGREDLSSRFTTQQPDDVAQGIVHILREGTTGSVWVSNNCRPVYQVEFPSLVKQ